MKKNQGFSLVELIIVIAIMAALVGILAPQYIKYVEKARATACSANRSQIMTEAQIVLVMSDGSETYKEIMEHLLGEEHPTCKSGGTYEILDDADGNPYVNCSEHGNSPNAASFGDSDTITTIINAMKSYRVTLDSTAGSDRISELTTTLSGSNIDMSAMGAAVWHYNTNGSLYWTMQGVGTLTVGQQVPVIKYNSNTGNYTVWYCSVEEKNLNGNTYLGLTNEKRPYSPSTSDSNQTYADALKYYNEALNGK